MSTQYRTPPNTFVRYEKREVFGAENTVCRQSPPSPRDRHIILLAADWLVALRASLKQWRNHRRTLQALAELDEHQLRDIGLTREEASPGHPTGYRTLAGLDEVRRHLP
jgi:uncharacterized protein YjiS (DUF1127 family)